MDDYYELRVEWDNQPGYRRVPISVKAPSDVIVVALKQVCDSVYGLRFLREITVKPVKA